MKITIEGIVASRRDSLLTFRLLRKGKKKNALVGVFGVIKDRILLLAPIAGARAWRRNSQEGTRRDPPVLERLNLKESIEAVPWNKGLDS